MQEPPPRQGPRSAVPGILVALVAVAAVGLLVRSPATTPDPIAPPSTALPTTGLPGQPSADPVAAPDPTAAPDTGWSTVGEVAPVDLLRPTPAVWTGDALVVGFSPLVAAIDPAPLRQVWGQLPPHPSGAVQVRGAVALPDVGILVYGTKGCAGCDWQPTLHALDPDELTWSRLPDAPGQASPDDEAVLSVGGRLIVVRDLGAAGVQALTYDPTADLWRDLGLPGVGDVEWQAVGGPGRHLLVVGQQARPLAGQAAETAAQPSGQPSPIALLHDLAAGTWQDVSAGLPVADPHRVAAVATGESFVLFGGSVRDGAARGAVLSAEEGRWTPLSLPPPDDGSLPALEGLGPLVGLSGVWDGQDALFVGGLTDPVFLAFSPRNGTWQVRPTPRARAGADLAWTGRQLLVWGGVDRMGQVVDLDVWADPQ